MKLLSVTSEKIDFSCFHFSKYFNSFPNNHFYMLRIRPRFNKFIFCSAIFCLISICANAQDSTEKARPFVLGEIRTIPSAVLAENRTLNIYLPEGYEQKDTARYPVIYLLDGSADEDFIHIAGLVQFLNFPWVNLLPKSIVVGIANVDRRRDFTFPTTIAKDKKDFPTTGHSATFIDFIGKELQPFIEKNYPTNGFRTIIGQSLGGLVATEILFKKPALFNRYIIVSPSLWWDHESLLKWIPKPLPDSVSVYVAVGHEGKIMETDAKNLVNNIRGRLPKSGMIQYEFFPAEDHGNILHKAVYNAFEKFAHTSNKEQAGKAKK
jgi:uncharacterized protein